MGGCDIGSTCCVGSCLSMHIYMYPHSLHLSVSHVTAADLCTHVVMYVCNSEHSRMQAEGVGVSAVRTPAARAGVAQVLHVPAHVSLSSFPPSPISFPAHCTFVSRIGSRRKRVPNPSRHQGAGRHFQGGPRRRHHRGEVLGHPLRRRRRRADGGQVLETSAEVRPQSQCEFLLSSAFDCPYRVLCFGLLSRAFCRLYWLKRLLFVCTAVVFSRPPTPDSTCTSRAPMLHFSLYIVWYR